MIMKPYRHFRVCRDDRDVVTVWLDHADSKVNIFDDEVLSELSLIIDAFSRDTQAKLVLFRSAKDSGFMAGADIRQIASLTVDEVMDVLERGHRLFDRIENLQILNPIK